jgi:AcrR family transcriptional regulator
MQVNPVPSPAPGAASGDSETRRLLKRVARRLFAERGIREVTVREIAQAAGQRNQGAIAYHFGTKEALVVELLTDGAQRIEARRHTFLDALEAAGGPLSVRDAVAAIVLPLAAFSDEDVEYGGGFTGFLLQLNVGDPTFVDRHLAGRWNRDYQRCLTHLRRLLPDKPRGVQNRRFVFLASYVSSLVAQREARMMDGERHPTWHAPDTLEDIVTTAAALLEA